jgi:outer membrane protein TolC
LHKFYILILALVFVAEGHICSQDRDLNFYIQSAVRNNPVVNENNSLIATYNLRKELVRTSVKSPSIFATANYLFAPTYNDIGYDSSITSGGLYSALLNLDYPLFRSSAFDVKLMSTDIEQNGFINTILTTKHDIEKNVTDQYTKSYFDLKQIDFINKMIALLDRQKTVVITLASHGLFKFTDISLLDIEYQNQIINLKKQEMLYKQDLLDLNLLAGIDDSSYRTIAAPDSILHKNEVNSSNFTAQFLLDSLKLDLDQRQLELNYKPQLNFFINAGLNAVTYINIQKKFGFSTGFNFTFSLYDGNQVGLNKQLTTIKKNILSNNKNSFIRLNLIRKTNILKKFDDLESLKKAQQTLVENYRSLLDIYANEIPSGQTTVIDFINLLKNYYSAENDLLSTQYQRVTLINEYNYWNW